MSAASFPAWLQVLSAVSLVVFLVCAVFIALDEVKRPQHMWIMNLVWPLTALFGSVLWLAFYLRSGRVITREQMQQMKREGEDVFACCLHRRERCGGSTRIASDGTQSSGCSIWRRTAALPGTYGNVCLRTVQHEN